MPPVQTSYPTRPAAAYEGMAADQNPATILSRTVETPEGIGFGRAAFQGARDESIAAAGAVFRGIVLADRNARPSPSGADLFAKGERDRARDGARRGLGGHGLGRERRRLGLRDARRRDHRRRLRQRPDPERPVRHLRTLGRPRPPAPELKRGPP